MDVRAFTLVIDVHRLTFCHVGHSRLQPRLRCLPHGQGCYGLLLRSGSRGTYTLKHLMTLLVDLCIAHNFCLQQQQAQQVLTQFQENPDSWTRVPDILEHSSFPQAKVCSDTLRLLHDL